MSQGLASETALETRFTAEGMAVALQDIAEAAGAEGATLTLSHGAMQIGAITSVGLQEHVAPYLSPNRPFDPRPSRVNPTLSEAFRLDPDDFTLEEIARDPYYQEFLKPRGFGWHACALLVGAPGAETVTLTLRRTSRQGLFEPGELAALAAQLPLIRATAAITRLTGELLGATLAADRDRRRAMFGFDKAGRAFIVREAAGADDIVRVRAGRLRAADPRQQARVSVTVERAQVERRPVSTMLYDPDDTAWIFSVVPAAAMAPAWMTPFVAWAVLAPCASPEEAAPARLRQIAELFGLSAAEARVAALIGSARTVANTAKVMSITPGTVRNHLKSIFSKTGVARQAELAVLLSRV